jgi:hypothetical protein
MALPGPGVSRGFSAAFWSLLCWDCRRDASLGKAIDMCTNTGACNAGAIECTSTLSMHVHEYHPDLAACPLILGLF